MAAGWIRFCVCILLVIGSGRALLADSSYREIFEAAWNEVAKSYYDSKVIDGKWNALRDRYADRLARVENREGFEALMAEMLRELGDSHFSIVSHSFSDLMPNAWGGGDAGLSLSVVGNRPVIHRVRPGSPAALAGIRPGFELSEVEGTSAGALFSKVKGADIFVKTRPYYFLKAMENRFYGPPGKSISLTVKNGRSGRPQSYAFELGAYSGLMSLPMGNIGETPIELETRFLKSGIAYLRFSLWMPSVMEEIRSFIKSIGEDSKGLIIDLRGNPGGIGLMAAGLAGMLVEEERQMGTMRLQKGHLNFNVYPQKGAFLGPLAVLIDNNSISTSEIFAADMKETGRGRLFGTKTPGAALPSVFKNLPAGYMLQMAIADYVTSSGQRIERIGVRPDAKVELSPSLLRKGQDNVVRAAEKWILRQNRSQAIKHGK